MKVEVIVYSIVWYVLNTLDAYTNKQFYVHYPYPITISLAHFLTNSLLFALVVRWKKIPHKPLDFKFIYYIAGSLLIL